MRVTDIRGTRVETRVEVGGLISAGKGVNLPGIQLPIPSLTEKDAADLAFALEHGVDYVALSFVRTAEDVAGLRARIDAAGSRARVIAKIEKAEALEHLDEIVEASRRRHGRPRRPRRRDRRGGRAARAEAHHPDGP